MSEAKLACRNNWADLTFEGRRSSLYVTNQFFAWGFLLTLTKKALIWEKFIGDSEGTRSRSDA